MQIEQILAKYVPLRVPAAVVAVRQNGRLRGLHVAGEAQAETLFDLASLTKLWTSTAFLRLVAAGRVAVEAPVATVLPTFVGKRPLQPYEDPLNPGEWVTVCTSAEQVAAEAVTFAHLLTHSSGLPAWRPLFRLPEAARRSAVLDSFFSYPTGTRVVYSDVGLILLGWAIEAITKRPLSAAVAALVTEPLGLDEVQFGPVAAAWAAPTEFCQWRQRRILGEVHDENAYALKGMAGHAGLFGTAAAVAGLGQAWLDVLAGRSDFLPQGLAETAVLCQAADGGVRRGWGWRLWSADPASIAHPFSPRTFGHTGFTGTSLYVDPARELVAVCLTNEVYNGRFERAIGGLRRELHESLARELPTKG